MISVPSKKIFRWAKISYSAHKYFKTELLVVLFVRDSKMYITCNFKLMTKKKVITSAHFPGRNTGDVRVKPGLYRLNQVRKIKILLRKPASSTAQLRSCAP